MKYVAFLRGINVGGKSTVGMKELKELFEDLKLNSVSTYINSGNIIFEYTNKNIDVLTQTLENTIVKKFGVSSKVLIITQKKLEKILKNIPTSWKKENQLRMYIAFVIRSFNVKVIAKEIKPKAGVDELKTGQGVLYMSTILSGLTKSGFTRIADKEFYKFITIRNLNTVQKIYQKLQDI